MKNHFLLINNIKRSHRKVPEMFSSIIFMCYRGLKKFLVPVLASLLESNERKRTTFDRFFQEVANIISKKVLNAFCPVTWSNMKIYVDKDTK